MAVQTQIAVIGAGDAHDDPVTGAAEEVGRLLAEGGAVLVCGGLGGVMAAACRGARRAGGLTVGILPGADPRAANRWVEVVIPSGMGEARNALVVRAGRAVIAVGGGHGTLSEIALALKAGTPVVGISTWDIPGVVAAPGPAEAVRLALAAARA